MDYRKLAKETCANIAEDGLSVIEMLFTHPKSTDRDMALLLVCKRYTTHQMDTLDKAGVHAYVTSDLTGLMWDNLDHILIKLERGSGDEIKQLVQDWMDGNEITLD